MRDYAKISPLFWVGPTGKAIRKHGAEAQVVAMYLMSSPHSNMIGLYHLPIVYISADTGIPMEGASKALVSLSEAGFCTYDDDAEMVWVHEMARYQIADSLHENDKQVKGINKEFANLPECQQLRGFWLKYKDAFHLENTRGLEGASKALRSQEQEQEIEQEQEQEILSSADAKAPPTPHQSIVDAYNAILGNTLTPVKPGLWANSSRAVALQARWRENPERHSLEWWEGWFRYIAKSPFLTGENDKNWKPDLGWLLKKENFIKVCEGKYHG